MSYQAQAEAIAGHYLAQTSNKTAAHNSHLADADTIAILLNAVSRGLNDTDSCLAAGLNPHTLKRWAQLAEADTSSAHATFMTALKTARAQGKVRRLEKIEKAGDDPKYWTANAWLLERTDPEQFALRREDSQVPQIVVHAEGARDIKIAVITPTFAPPTSLLSDANTVDMGLLASDKSDYVNQTPALELASAASESPGGPTPPLAVAGGQQPSSPQKEKNEC